jgi:hypothetical protein
MAGFTRLGKLSSDEGTSKATVSTDSTVGAITYSIAQMFGGLILRNGGGVVSDVTPTATQLVAAIDNCAIGDSWDLYIENANAGALTITAPDASVTVVGTAAIASGQIQRFLCVVTAVGTPAVSLYSLGTATY